MDRILGDDSMGQCEKINSYEHVSNCEWLPIYSCLKVHIKKKSSVNGNKERELVGFTLILSQYLNDKFVTQK